MRGTESEETIQRRLRHAIEDVETARAINFDLVIVNSELNEAAAKFTDFVRDVSTLWCSAFANLTLFSPFSQDVERLRDSGN